MQLLKFLMLWQMEQNLHFTTACFCDTGFLCFIKQVDSLEQDDMLLLNFFIMLVMEKS